VKLFLKPFTLALWDLYAKHGHFHDGDAGLDLFIPRNQTILAGETAFIHLQVACESEGNRPYFLLPRSSISKTPLRMANSIGLIDGGYRGELIAAVDNIKTESYQVVCGQRLFQIIALDGSPIHLQLVKTLSPTERGKGGFGSTGI